MVANDRMAERSVRKDGREERNRPESKGDRQDPGRRSIRGDRRGKEQRGPHSRERRPPKAPPQRCTRMPRQRRIDRAWLAEYARRDLPSDSDGPSRKNRGGLFHVPHAEARCDDVGVCHAHPAPQDWFTDGQTAHARFVPTDLVRTEQAAPRTQIAGIADAYARKLEPPVRGEEARTHPERPDDPADDEDHDGCARPARRVPVGDARRHAQKIDAERGGEPVRAPQQPGRKQVTPTAEDVVNDPPCAQGREDLGAALTRRRSLLRGRRLGGVAPGSGGARTQQPVPQLLGIGLRECIEMQGRFARARLLAGADRDDAKACQAVPELGVRVDTADPVAPYGAVLAHQHTGATFDVGVGDAIAGESPAHDVEGRSEHAEHGDQSQRPQRGQRRLDAYDNDCEHARRQREEAPHQVDPDDSPAQALPWCGDDAGRRQVLGCGIHVASPTVSPVTTAKRVAASSAVRRSRPCTSTEPYDDAVVTRKVARPSSCSSGPRTESTV